MTKSVGELVLLWLSEQEYSKFWSRRDFFFLLYFSQLEFKFDFMLHFMIQKRSGVICIFWHFKQFTVAQKRILKTCLKSATAVLKELNGRNQPWYSIVLLILYCQMERAALDNEEQWVFPSLSCPTATCLLSKTLLLIYCFMFYCPTQGDKVKRRRRRRNKKKTIWSVYTRKQLLLLLQLLSSYHLHLPHHPNTWTAL